MRISDWSSDVCSSDLHLGLSVSPDIGTLLYTLSGKANAAEGWGREAESWGFMSAVRSLGGEDWFQLGDGDLALHVLRSQRRQRGDPLSTIIADFASAWGIARSEEHTSELQSLMRISYAVFCLKKKNIVIKHHYIIYLHHFTNTTLL